MFDVLAYTDTDVAVPFTWIESDPKLIANPQMVKLHAFDTKVRKQKLETKSDYSLWNVLNVIGFHSLQIHKVDTLVSYKNDEWDEEE